MNFIEFVHKYNLKKATSNMKIPQIFSSFELHKIDIYLTDGQFSSDVRNVYLHPSKETHWVCYIKDCYFDSY